MHGAKRGVEEEIKRHDALVDGFGCGVPVFTTNARMASPFFFSFSPSLALCVSLSLSPRFVPSHLAFVVAVTTSTRATMSAEVVAAHTLSFSMQSVAVRFHVRGLVEQYGDGQRSNSNELVYVAPSSKCVCCFEDTGGNARDGE